MQSVITSDIDRHQDLETVFADYIWPRFKHIVDGISEEIGEKIRMSIFTDFQREIEYISKIVQISKDKEKAQPDSWLEFRYQYQNLLNLSKKTFDAELSTLADTLNALPKPESSPEISQMAKSLPSPVSQHSAHLQNPEHKPEPLDLLLQAPQPTATQGIVKSMTSRHRSRSREKVSRIGDDLIVDYDSDDSSESITAVKNDRPVSQSIGFSESDVSKVKAAIEKLRIQIKKDSELWDRWSKEEGVKLNEVRLERMDTSVTPLEFLEKDDIEAVYHIGQTAYGVSGKTHYVNCPSNSQDEVIQKKIFQNPINSFTLVNFKTFKDTTIFLYKNLNAHLSSSPFHLQVQKSSNSLFAKNPLISINTHISTSTISIHNNEILIADPKCIKSIDLDLFAEFHDSKTHPPVIDEIFVPKIDDFLVWDSEVVLLLGGGAEVKIYRRGEMKKFEIRKDIRLECGANGKACKLKPRVFLAGENIVVANSSGIFLINRDLKLLSSYNSTTSLSVDTIQFNSSTCLLLLQSKNTLILFSTSNDKIAELGSKFNISNLFTSFQSDMLIFRSTKLHLA